MTTMMLTMTEDHDDGDDDDDADDRHDGDDALVSRWLKQ